MTNPGKEYLRNLQSKCSPIIIEDLNTLLLRRQKQLHLSDDDLKRISEEANGRNGLDFQEEFYKQQLIIPFFKLLPDHIWRRLENVIVGFLPTYKINASAIRSPGGTPIVILHTQLMTAIAHFNEAQIIAGKLLIDTNEESKIHGKELLISAYSEIVTCVLYHQYLPKMTHLPTTLNSVEHRYAFAKTFMHELFIILHEFAHIYLGHLEQTNTVNFADLKSEYNLEEYVRKQKLELEADILAAEWIIEAGKNVDKLGGEPWVLLKIAPHLIFEVFILFHLLDVNSGRYGAIQSKFDIELDEIETNVRIIKIAQELSGLLVEDKIDDHLDHPKGLVRLMNIISHLGDKLDEDNFSRCVAMIRHSVSVESFMLK